MELLPDHLLAELPTLGSQQDTPDDERIIYAKYFIPGITYTWLVAEGEELGRDYIFFAYVISEAGEEWKTFPLSEIEEVNEKAEELKNMLDMSGLSVERVMNFKPTKFKDALASYRDEALT